MYVLLCSLIELAPVKCPFVKMKNQEFRLQPWCCVFSMRVSELFKRWWAQVLGFFCSRPTPRFQSHRAAALARFEVVGASALPRSRPLACGLCVAPLLAVPAPCCSQTQQAKGPTQPPTAPFWMAAGRKVLWQWRGTAAGPSFGLG